MTTTTIKPPLTAFAPQFLVDDLERSIVYEISSYCVSMTVSFASDGQVCEAVIEPKRVTEPGVDWEKKIPAALAREIVDEVVPVAQRGRQVSRMTMGNYTSWSWADYEKVKISSSLVGVGRPEKELKVDKVRIRWKERRCQ